MTLAPAGNTQDISDLNCQRSCPVLYRVIKSIILYLQSVSDIRLSIKGYIIMDMHRDMGRNV